VVILKATGNNVGIKDIETARTEMAKHYLIISAD
jgi:hypothetical protein